MDYIVFLAAMAALIYGAGFIIKESERIALHFNISHFVIGATLIAFGTSLPEMAASMMASYHGKSDMAVANVVGSVIFNISLVLGVVFMIAKSMNPQRNLFAKDSAWVIVPVVIFYIMIQDGEISRFDGVLFLLMMVSYLLFLFSSSKDDLEGEIDEDLEQEKFNWPKSILLLSIGFLFTIGGANYVVESGTNIAHSLGVSEWIIGLFLISLGTSLPELVVSLVAVKKGNAEMSIGNIIGSNVANFSMVLGGSALINPLTIDLQATNYDIMILASASIALLFILANKIYNKAGGIFLLTILALFITHSI
ncbi:calcium/sodium antiporter [Sulfurimonas paralvinellae]|uniref:Calcium/sodium antiporter n=1 Tax=Sulfurimonas paralvinellae TaxID=317658 RepID=A0A7M1BA15_9BACT|nr:calcium/sodium antiporter [Sulfurimonas paralvinellae]QOP45678.1 calcium/sodium antiporter [Sulfurimonas paralvinellae]